MSRNSRSGVSEATLPAASSTLPASPTISIHGNSASKRRNSRRAGGSSSTIRAFMRPRESESGSWPGPVATDRGRCWPARRTTGAAAPPHCAARSLRGFVCDSVTGRGFSISSMSTPAVSSPRILSTPPAGKAAMPCLMAFSTTVCRSMTGMRTRRASAVTLQSIFNRSSKRNDSSSR